MGTQNIPFYKFVEVIYMSTINICFYKEKENTYHISIIKYALQEILCPSRSALIRKIFHYILCNFEKLKHTVQ